MRGALNCLPNDWVTCHMAKFTAYLKQGPVAHNIAKPGNQSAKKDKS